MQQKIEQLKELFKQREEIDNQIGELIGGEAEKPKKKALRRANQAKETVKKWSRKYDSCVECGTTDRVHRSRGLCSRCYGGSKSKNSNKEVTESKLNKQEGKKYHCENCDHEFHSDAHYLEVKCPECNSRSLLTLKQ